MCLTLFSAVTSNLKTCSLAFKEANLEQCKNRRITSLMLSILMSNFKNDLNRSKTNKEHQQRQHI